MSVAAAVLVVAAGALVAAVARTVRSWRRLQAACSAVVGLTQGERDNLGAYLRGRGCTCEPEIVADRESRRIITLHDDWCPLGVNCAGRVER